MTYLMLGHQLPIIKLFLWENTDSNSRGEEALQQGRLWTVSCAVVCCAVSVLFHLFFYGCVLIFKSAFFFFFHLRATS